VKSAAFYGKIYLNRSNPERFGVCNSIDFVSLIGGDIGCLVYHSNWESQTLGASRKINARERRCAFGFGDLFWLLFSEHVSAILGRAGPAGEINLEFFWPRPNVKIKTQDIVEIRIKEDPRHRANLILVSRQNEFRSIVCFEGPTLRKIHKALQMADSNRSL